MSTLSPVAVSGKPSPPTAMAAFQTQSVRQPTRTTSTDSPLPFRVWAHQPIYLEDTRPWKCVAAFYYLTEALDYIACRQDNGVDVVFQSPAHTNLIRWTDRRVVFDGTRRTIPCADCRQETSIPAGATDNNYCPNCRGRNSQ